MNDRDAFEWVVQYRVEGDLDDLIAYLSTLSPLNAAILMPGNRPTPFKCRTRQG